ncbi:hypothetical protein C8R46DRAFT_442285 [Mycena filopes]|nr:hypothetical protein C8R46DRAFT_442285 [Mycena filopes]
MLDLCARDYGLIDPKNAPGISTLLTSSTFRVKNEDEIPRAYSAHATNPACALRLILSSGWDDDDAAPLIDVLRGHVQSAAIFTHFHLQYRSTSRKAVNSQSFSPLAPRDLLRRHFLCVAIIRNRDIYFKNSRLPPASLVPISRLVQRCGGTWSQNPPATRQPAIHADPTSIRPRDNARVQVLPFCDYRSTPGASNFLRPIRSSGNDRRRRRPSYFWISPTCRD